MIGAHVCGFVLVQILKHDWLVKEGVAYDISLDSVVLKRMKQFAQVRCLAEAYWWCDMHAAQQMAICFQHTPMHARTNTHIPACAVSPVSPTSLS